MTVLWRHRLSLGLLAARLLVALALVPVAIDWRSPLLSGIRPAALAALVVIPLLLISADVWTLRRPSHGRLSRMLSWAVLVAAGTALIATLVIETRFQSARARVLDADPAQLEKLGRHFIVGFRDAAELEALLARRAIGGVFVGARNVENASTESIRQQVESWQSTRQRQGLPRLFIAADQEGGAVSRLSPPLPRQPPLASVAAGPADKRQAAAREFGSSQGRALATVGVNVNLAPVADVNYSIVNPNDRYTRIRDRAISADPLIVADVARHYCVGLRQAAVQCTLKHFPGLGRVFEDTHLESGDLNVPVDELERSDWIPFRTLMAEGTMTMLSHARLTAIDPDTPVSFSERVVAGLLRGGWGYEGVLITDDFSMRAVYANKDGIGTASVAALNAGVDLILIAYDPDQYFRVMDALLAADRDGRLRPAALERSNHRLLSHGPAVNH